MYPTDDTPDPDEHTAWDTNRPRGVLSPQDRAFLLEHEDSDVKRSEEGTETGAERNTRLRIRKRIYNALLDFALIYSYLPERDRRLIFSNPRRNPDGELDLWNGAIFTLAFLYERLSGEDAYQNFEYSLQAAILEVLDKPGMAKHNELDVLGDVMVDIDTSRVVDLGRVGEKIGREGYLALDENELEAIEILVDSKSDDEIHPDFKKDLLSDVEKVRAMDEDEKAAQREIQETVSKKFREAWSNALEDIEAMSEEEKEKKLEELEDVGEES